MASPQYLEREVNKYSGIMHWLETQRAPSTLSKDIDDALPSCSSKNYAHKEKKEGFTTTQSNKYWNRMIIYKSPNQEGPADESSAQSTKSRAQTCVIVTKNEYFESTSNDDISESEQSNISQTSYVESSKSDDKSNLSNDMKFSNNYSTVTNVSLIHFSVKLNTKYEIEENNYRIKPKIKYRSILKKKCYTKNKLKTINDNSSDSVDTRTYILQNRAKSKHITKYKRKSLSHVKFEIPKSDELLKHTHKKKNLYEITKTLSPSGDTDSIRHKNVSKHDISADLFNSVNDFANKLQIKNAFVSSQRTEVCNLHFCSTNDNQAFKEIDKNVYGVKNEKKFYNSFSSSNILGDIPKSLMKDKKNGLEVEKEPLSNGKVGFCDCLSYQLNCLDCDSIYDMDELYHNGERKLDSFDSSLHQNYVINGTQVCEHQQEGTAGGSKHGIINFNCINKKVSEMYFTDISKYMPDIANVTYHGVLENLVITIDVSGKRHIALGPPLDDDKYFSKDHTIANIDDQEDIYDDDISIICFVNDEGCVTFYKDGVSFSTLQEILNANMSSNESKPPK